MSEPRMIAWLVAVLAVVLASFVACVRVGLRPRSTSFVGPRDILAIVVSVLIFTSLQEYQTYTTYRRQVDHAAEHHTFVEMRGNHEFWDSPTLGSALIQRWRWQDIPERRAGSALAYASILTIAWAIARLYARRRAASEGSR